jgi:hypothetical protein
MMIGATFGDLPLYAVFYDPLCEIALMKTSSRTARLGGNGAVRWFSKGTPIICDTSEVDYD